MICKKCKKVFEEDEMYGKGKLYCEKCYKEKSEFIKGRKYKLTMLQSLPLDLKIIKSDLCNFYFHIGITGVLLGIFMDI